MSEPLTPEEEAQWRSWLAAGHMPFGTAAMQGERIARLLATLDATRATPTPATLRATPDGLAELVREMRYHHNLAGRDVAYTAGWDDATRMLLDRLADLDANVEEMP